MAGSATARWRAALSSCSIHENYRGVQTDTSMLLMQACNVSLNSPNGGVVMLEGNILDSTIADNFQQGDGGGIFIQKSGSISDSELIGKLALGAVDDNVDGGGVFILGDSGLDSLSVPTKLILDGSVDQRGLPRVKQDGNKDGGADGDGCEIGAFEIQN